jgi:hypothetical protein
MENKHAHTPADAIRPIEAESIKGDRPELDAYEAALKKAVANDIATIVEILKGIDDVERER